MSEDRILCLPRSLVEINSDIPEDSELNTTALILFFSACSLLLGAALREISKKSGIPCPPMLLAIGLFLSAYIHEFKVFGPATQEFLRIGPYGIILVFIPALVFESAFNSDWYILKKVMKNLFLLSVPGVLYSSLLLAFGLKVFLLYDDNDLTWPHALALGALASTTDPIAINSLLKSIGTHSKFKLLLEGEALFNNGMALAFFMVFIGFATDEVTNLADASLSFVQISGGGLLFGVVVGVLCSMWLKQITRDYTLSIAITFIASYLLFFAAETQIFVSGILSLVALGLFVSAYGKSKIDTKTEDRLRSVWAWVQHAAETIVYIVAGLVVGYDLLYREDSTIEVSDWYKMLVFYGFMIGARIVMIGTFYPYLRKHGYGLNGKEFFALVWGGLKGVIALSLALTTAIDDVLPRRARDLILFYIASMTVLTLLINGTTCNWLVERMEMLVEPEIKTTLQKNLIADMMLKSQEKEQKLKENGFLTLANWKAVRQLASLEEELTTVPPPPQAEGDQNQGGFELEDLTGMAQKRSAYQFFKDDDVFQETRFKLLRIMKGIIWDKYEKGLLSGEAARLLVKGVDSCLDSTEQPIDLWSFLYEYFNSFTLIKFLMKVKDFFLIGKLFKRYITNHISFIYGITTIFIDVCSELLEAEDPVLSNTPHIKTILEEIEKIRSDAENYILDLQGNFLEILQAVQIHRAASQILGHQKYFLDEMLHTGQIEEKEYATLARNVDRKLNSLDSLRIEWHFPNFSDFIVQFPIFQDLTPDDMRDLQKDSEQKPFHKGDYLYEVNWPSAGLFIVTKGRVIESVDGKKTFSRGVGNILSFINLVNEQKKALTTCEAFSDVQTTFIPFDKIDVVLKRNHDFEEKVYKHACSTYLYTFDGKDAQNQKLEETKINDIMRKARLLTYREKEKFHLRNGGFLFTGGITKVTDAKAIEKFSPANFSLIMTGRAEYMATKVSKVLVFDEESRELFSTGDALSERRQSISPETHSSKKSVRMSFREAFQRDMFDKEFRSMMGRNRYDDFLS